MMSFNLCSVTKLFIALPPTSLEFPTCKVHFTRRIFGKHQNLIAKLGLLRADYLVCTTELALSVIAMGNEEVFAIEIAKLERGNFIKTILVLFFHYYTTIHYYSLLNRSDIFSGSEFKFRSFSQPNRITMANQGFRSQNHLYHSGRSW